MNFERILVRLRHVVTIEIIVSSLLIPFTVPPQVVQLHEWKDVKSVFIYLSMPWELSSKALVETLFTNGCKVYVPRIVGKESKDMKVVSIFWGLKHWPPSHRTL